MMVYLDNWLSVGPDSSANGVNPARPSKSKRGSRGLNENYGRELMELQTLGVDGGYTQADVTALSAILTCWTVDHPDLGGPFLFDPKRHQPGPKQWLGHTLATPTNPALGSSPGASSLAAPLNGVGSATAPGQLEGLEVLNLLARSPRTARFISFLIAQRFVADTPPPPLVDRLAATYPSADGDIRAILRTLIESPEFNSRQYFRVKVKTPFEFIASAFRSTATDPSSPGALVSKLRQMGMPVFSALTPTGYYLTADHWMNSTALVDRLNFAHTLTSVKLPNQKFDSPRLLALGLMAQPGFRPAPAWQGSLTTASFERSTTLPPPAGPDIALHIFEATLIGSRIAPQTDQLITRQIAAIAPTLLPPPSTPSTSSPPSSSAAPTSSVTSSIPWHHHDQPAPASNSHLTPGSRSMTDFDRRQFASGLLASTLIPASPAVPEHFLLEANGWIPNNAVLSVLLYRNAVPPGDPEKTAHAMEKTFATNG